MEHMRRHHLEVLKQNWALISLGLGALALIVGAAYWQSYSQSLPTTVERGTVLRFGGAASDEGDRLLVVVRTANGEVLNLPTSLARVRDCRAGEAIMLERRGGRISGLARMPCRTSAGANPRQH